MLDRIEGEFRCIRSGFSPLARRFALVRAYLNFNAAIFLLFAVWCTFAPIETARQVGYTALSHSGISEYLVVYGGLQLGLALLFFHCAQRGEARFGLRLALTLYAPIVVYRWTTLAWQWPVANATLAIGALETLLLAIALVLWKRSRKRVFI
jgi:hypothetical protein